MYYIDPGWPQLAISSPRLRSQRALGREIDEDDEESDDDAKNDDDDDDFDPFSSICGVTKMALSVPETKNGDNFLIIRNTLIRIKTMRILIIMTEHLHKSCTI